MFSVFPLACTDPIRSVWHGMNGMRAAAKVCTIVTVWERQRRECPVYGTDVIKFATWDFGSHVMDPSFLKVCLFNY